MNYPPALPHPPDDRSPMKTSPPDENELAFHLSEVMVPTLRELYRLFDGDITMALVLGELGQYVAEPRFHPDRQRQTSGRRHSNALSIAAASGIPRETVRRKLKKLAERGWIVENDVGGFTLNEQFDGHFAKHFADYNKTLLQAMRKAVKTLAAHPH